MFWLTHWQKPTLKAPSRNNVGSKPTEKIRRRMVEAISALIPCGCGKTMTIARDTSMAIHSSADKWGSKVPKDKDQTERQRGQNSNLIISNKLGNYKQMFIF